MTSQIDTLLLKLALLRDHIKIDMGTGKKREMNCSWKKVVAGIGRVRKNDCFKCNLLKIKSAFPSPIF